MMNNSLNHDADHHPPSDLSGRRLKTMIGEALRLPDIGTIMARLSGIPARRAINSMMSYLCSPDPVTGWMARVAAGRVTAHLAETDVESARVIMRRFMWMLNDESGGIGWGVPEAMAEAIVCNDRIADEYAAILRSYLFEDQNYLELPALQQGLLWGIGRVAEIRPGIMAETGDTLIGFMSSPDPVHRGYAARAAGNLGIGGKTIETLINDDARILIFTNECLKEISVAELAGIALSKIVNG